MSGRSTSTYTRGFALALATAVATALSTAPVGPSTLAAQTSAQPVATRPTASAPADSALDAATRSLASELRCPVCQGLSVQDSPSELAQQMRDVVRQQLENGKSPDEVKDYFVARYGQWILMTPPAAGFNWLVYSLPAVVLVIGAGMLVVLVRRWTAVPHEAGMPTDPNASHTMH
jgi:cytochrome c-type biogenesis protein CcmH